jgi:predicted metal-dependent hydrolase
MTDEAVKLARDVVQNGAREANGSDVGPVRKCDILARAVLEMQEEIKKLSRALEDDPEGRRNVILQDAIDIRHAEEEALRDEVDRLRAALKDALDIADYEASEYQGKADHLVRLAQMRKEWGL